jgi:hypothetical protein
MTRLLSAEPEDTTHVGVERGKGVPVKVGRYTNQVEG